MNIYNIFEALLYTPIISIESFEHSPSFWGNYRQITIYLGIGTTYNFVFLSKCAFFSIMIMRKIRKHTDIFYKCE